MEQTQKSIQKEYQPPKYSNSDQRLINRDSSLRWR